MGFPQKWGTSSGWISTIGEISTFHPENLCTKNSRASGVLLVILANNDTNLCKCITFKMRSRIQSRLSL